jgi:hypothetical protein
MRHYAQLSAARRRALFHREPAEFGLDSDVRTLGVALGATLYCPATRPTVRAVARDDLKLVGLAVHGPRNAVDKVLKGAVLHP